MDTQEDHRPWGHYEVLTDGTDHKVKRMTVYPGQRLSLQRHRHRAEHWFFMNGGMRFDSDVRDPALQDLYGPAQRVETAPGVVRVAVTDLASTMPAVLQWFKNSQPIAGATDSTWTGWMAKIIAASHAPGISNRRSTRQSRNALRVCNRMLTR